MWPFHFLQNYTDTSNDSENSQRFQCFFWDKVSLYSSIWPWPCYVALKLSSCLSLPRAGVTDIHHHPRLSVLLMKAESLRVLAQKKIWSFCSHKNAGSKETKVIERYINLNCKESGAFSMKTKKEVPLCFWDRLQLSVLEYLKDWNLKVSDYSLLSKLLSPILKSWLMLFMELKIPEHISSQVGDATFKLELIYWCSIV